MFISLNINRAFSFFYIYTQLNLTPWFIKGVDTKWFLAISWTFPFPPYEATEDQPLSL